MTTPNLKEAKRSQRKTLLRISKTLNRRMPLPQYTLSPTVARQSREVSTLKLSTLQQPSGNTFKINLRMASLTYTKRLPPSPPFVVSLSESSTCKRTILNFSTSRRSFITFVRTVKTLFITLYL